MKSNFYRLWRFLSVRNEKDQQPGPAFLVFHPIAFLSPRRGIECSGGVSCAPTNAGALSHAVAARKRAADISGVGSEILPLQDSCGSKDPPLPTSLARLRRHLSGTPDVMTAGFRFGFSLLRDNREVHQPQRGFARLLTACALAPTREYRLRTCFQSGSMRANQSA
jgi:hypothetical protein